MEPPRPRPEPAAEAAERVRDAAAEGGAAVSDAARQGGAAALDALAAIGGLGPLGSAAAELAGRTGLPPAVAEAVTGGVVLAASGVALATLRLRTRRRIRRSVAPCRWRPEGFRGGGARLSAWRCLVCGVVAYAADGRPPKECKRALRDAAL